MYKQQLTFSFTFIGLGVLLGWYSHTAYNASADNKTAIVSVEIQKMDKPKAHPILPVKYKIESFQKQFTDLIDTIQYDNALAFYQNKESEQQTQLFSILVFKINELMKESESETLTLLNVFLQDYYNNSQLLLFKANVLIATGKIKQALDTFLLAKNYAIDNEEYLSISNEIHEFSKFTYHEYTEKKEWGKNIDFFKILIENEPDYAFYHLCLAESFIKSGEQEMAVTSLDWIKDDVIYGERAMELLDMLMLNLSQQGVKLNKSGEQYVLSGILSGFYEVKLLLDTGASYSSLPSYIIAQLVQEHQAEKVGRKQINTAGGIVDADIFKLKQMTIGSFSVNDIIVVELDLESSRDQKNDFEGLLGMNFLSHFDFSINQQLTQLFLTPKLN